MPLTQSMCRVYSSSSSSLFVSFGRSESRYCSISSVFVNGQFSVFSSSSKPYFVDSSYSISSLFHGMHLVDANLQYSSTSTIGL